MPQQKRPFSPRDLLNARLVFSPKSTAGAAFLNASPICQWAAATLAFEKEIRAAASRLNFAAVLPSILLSLLCEADGVPPVLRAVNAGSEEVGTALCLPILAALALSLWTKLRLARDRRFLMPALLCDLLFDELMALWGVLILAAAFGAALRFAA